jgi:uncharacterized protein (DUF433 family)
MPAAVLEREMYTEAEAGRLLGVPQSTLHYWLEGGRRRGKTYPPIIRQEARGRRAVTWAELVEAGLLRAYRRTHDVPMRELRKFVDVLRDQLGVPYPLADRRPYVSARNLVYDAQTAAELGADFWLVAVMDDQLMLTPPSQSFVDRVEWDGDVAAGWRPDPNPLSPVRISPKIRFGRPAINGISTEAIWEQIEDAGEEISAVAETYHLTERDIRWAVAFENAARAA